MTCLALATACSDDASTEGSSSATMTSTDTSGDGDGDPTGDGDGDPTGDGDGDGDPTGDGDGDPAGGVCGDGAVGPGEECDAGADNSPTGECTPDCTIAACGDGYVQDGVEACDDQNEVTTDDCIACAAAACGDGYVHEGVEMCDDGNDDDADGCNNMCLPGSCGDGIIQPGETCDDGNGDTTDACPACEPATCGDGFIQADVELCDDGNLETNDECISPACVPATCGDGLLWDGVETCDDGNDDDGDACPGSCEPGVCGDGYTWEGMEQCDDGNDIDDDDCSNTCTASADFVYLTSSNGSAGFYRYIIEDDSWETLTNPPSTTRSQLTNDGTSVFLMGADNTVYSYDGEDDSWADVMPGPGNATGNPIGLFQWFPDGFYYLNDGTTTLEVYRDGQWSDIQLDASASCAGTFDAATGELYIRTYNQAGFSVIDTTDDTIARTIVDATNVGENSRTGSYVNGYFYSRTFTEAFIRFDGVDGTVTQMLGDPTSDHTATDTDFFSGRIYVAGYGGNGTVFQVYDPAEDEMIDLANSPSVSNHSTITVMH